MFEQRLLSKNQLSDKVEFEDANNNGIKLLLNFLCQLCLIIYFFPCIILVNSLFFSSLSQYNIYFTPLKSDSICFYRKIATRPLFSLLYEEKTFFFSYLIIKFILKDDFFLSTIFYIETIIQVIGLRHFFY